MAVNKVIYGDTTLIDITDSTVTSSDLRSGVTAYGSNGVKLMGSFDPSIYYIKPSTGIPSSDLEEIYATQSALSSLSNWLEEMNIATQQYVDSRYVIAGQKVNTSLGSNATAEGIDTTASAIGAHAEGLDTIAAGAYQHVFGTGNISDAGLDSSSQGTYVEIVGNGTNSSRSNARTLDWSGNESLAGSLTIGKDSNDEIELTPEWAATRMPPITYGTPSVVVDTTTISFSQDGSNSWYISAKNPFSGVSSSTFYSYAHLYIIEWDGVEYKLFLKNISESGITRQVGGSAGSTFGWSYLGNVVTIGYNGTYYEKQCPFAITRDYMENKGEIYVFSYDTSASHTIKVTIVPYTKKNIDPILYSDVNDGRGPICFGGGIAAVLEGDAAKANGNYSHAEGEGTNALGMSTHAEGHCTTASATAAHAEGYTTTASGSYSHSEGYGTVASATRAHAEGNNTTASGSVSHAEGQQTVASGYMSHAEGEYTIATHKAQHVFGRYNIADTSAAASSSIGDFVEIVGNGTASDARSNARTLDWSGNESLAGNLILGKDSNDEIELTPKWAATRMPSITYGTPSVVVDTTTVSFSQDGTNSWYKSAENPFSGCTASTLVDFAAEFRIEWDSVEYVAYAKTAYDENSVRSVGGSGGGTFDWTTLDIRLPSKRRIFRLLSLVITRRIPAKYMYSAMTPVRLIQ